MDLTVTVMRGKAVVDKIEQRPIRILPDRNTAGVVYKKSVYPLRASNDAASAAGSYIIDLNDKAWDKDACPFAPSGRQICRTGEANLLGLLKKADEVPRPTVKWHVESNGYGHYLVFDGNRALLQQILLELRSEQIEVIRADECYRPADDGYQYDWFVRMPLDQRSSAEVCTLLSPLIARAELALRSSPVTSVAVDAAARLAQLQELFGRLQGRHLSNDGREKDEEERKRREEELLGLRARVRQLEAKAALDQIALERANSDQSRARALAEQLRKLKTAYEEGQEERANQQRSHARLLQLLEHERASAARPTRGDDTSRLRQRVEDLQSELADTKDRLTSSANALARELANVQRLSGNEARLQMAMQETNARAARVDAERRGAEEAWEEAEARAKAREEELANFKAAIAQTDSPRKGGAVYSRAIGCLIAHCFPRLEFSADAVEEVVSKDLHRSAKLWETLREVNDYRRDSATPAPGWKRLKGVHGRWCELERHIADGQQGAAVRIYSETPADRSGKVRIQIHWKKDGKEQQRVIDHLGDQWRPFMV